MTSKRNIVVRLRTFAHAYVVNSVRMFYNKVWGTHIGERSRISLSAKIDKTYPEGVFIGSDTAVAFGAAILTHDFVNRRHLKTTIGDCCFIGANAIVMPGVTVGDHCIIGTGAVVMKNVPARSVVLGNPGRVMERGIMTGPLGYRIDSPASPETTSGAEDQI